MKTLRRALVSLACITSLCLALSCAGRPEWNGTLRTAMPDSTPEISYPCGNFTVTLSAAKHSISVTHSGDPERILWESIPGRNFIALAEGKETVKEKRSMFRFKDETKALYVNQVVTGILREGDGIVISGHFNDGGKRAPYRCLLRPAGANQLSFEISSESPGINRVHLLYRSQPDERFFGFGEQFTYFDLKGKEVPIFVSEQGVGRGAQPITMGANLTAGAGGSWATSYAPVPHYITSRLNSLFLENYEYSVFDLTGDDRVGVRVFSNTMKGRIIYGDSPLALIQEYTGFSGRMRPLPDWIMGGAVVGLQGGTERVMKLYDSLKRHGTPVAALWLQDWVGRRVTKFGKQLWWNWELDTERYPGWGAFRESLARDGVRVMTYINPYLVDVTEKKNHRRDLYTEARRKGYVVKKRDGSPYPITITYFDAALVDLTNPAARAWIKDIIRRELIGNGSSGWMADFGEGLPYDSVLASGDAGSAYHNRYPEEWARVNQEAVREAGKEGEAVYFLRSGFSRSPGEAALFWEGDQLVSWDGHDGIRSAVTGLLSGGISGYALNHSDIGGYTTIASPIKNYFRSRELLMRWMELNAFTAVFRSHEGNMPEKNAQAYSDEETLAHFSRCAKIYTAWLPYRRLLVREASEKGYPVVRHLFLHYPGDPAVYTLRHEEFMVGSDFLVAPVLDPDTASVEAYLPAGRWVHLWSGRSCGDASGGTRITVEAPMGKPAVFYKEGSEHGRAFVRELQRMGVMERL
jgi:alpha-glucosidase (family GH31 glycosyl hydrolase)